MKISSAPDTLAIALRRLKLFLTDGFSSFSDNFSFYKETQLLNNVKKLTGVGYKNVSQADVA